MKTDPASIERLTERVSADFLNEEMAWLREHGMADIAALFYEHWRGFAPASIADRARAHNAETEAARRALNPNKAKADRVQWRAANRPKVREYKRKERDANYFRPFVAIDSEGPNYPGENDLYFDEASGRVLYQKHETYLWGAAADNGREPEWLTAQGYSPANKRPLTIIEILDWLLSLPKRFGRVNFSVLYWGEYAFSYFKGKWLEIYHIRDRETHVRTVDENGRRLPKYDKSIKIYDTFGFFQSGFSTVVKGMVEAGRAKPDEAEYLDGMKKLRDDPEIWAAQDIEAIKRYTTIELRLLAREMAVLRQGFIDMDNMRLQSWHGPGAAASAFLRGRSIPKKYYPDDIRAESLSPWQLAAHRAYHAGHIEMMKHGYIENTVLHVLDIASAYPAATVELPSMKGGHWTAGGYVHVNSLAQLRAQIEAASMLSMFRIRFVLPQYEKYHADPHKSVFIPFHPLPYRCKGGGIIYPAYGHGWYMRDDVLALIAWLEHFVPAYPEMPKQTAILIEEAWYFEPESDEKPFKIFDDFYNERKRIKAENQFDTREKAIKLNINSIYGQYARYVGEAGKVPATANPWYAAAITAATRRRLMEAGVRDPHAIVFFATDGIVSTRELTGLPRVRKAGESVELGDWEHCEADGGLFVQAGVYTYGKVKIGKDGRRSIVPVSKLRGATAKNYTNEEKGAGAWLIRETLARWRAPCSTTDATLGVSAPYKKYITAGAALASPERWKAGLAGRWTPKPGQPNAAYRVINVSDPGGKRALLDDGPETLSTAERPADRCSTLIPTIPVLNRDDEMSRPRTPQWIGGDASEVELEEQAGFG